MDPYADSSEGCRSLVAQVVNLRMSQDDYADRIIERDRELRTGGANFIVRMERIFHGNASVSRKVEAKVVGMRNRGKRRRR